MYHRFPDCVFCTLVLTFGVPEGYTISSHTGEIFPFIFTLIYIIYNIQDALYSKFYQLYCCFFVLVVYLIIIIFLNKVGSVQYKRDARL